MEDENRVYDIIKRFKIIFIIIFILIIMWIAFYFIMQEINKNTANDYFKNNGYTNDNGVWYKEVKASEENDYTSINYVYNADLKMFTKSLNTQNGDFKQEMSFQVYKDKDIDVTYSFEGDEDGKSCTLIQSATYNYKNKKFNCSVDLNDGNCDLKCDVIKEEVDTFTKEFKDIADNSRIDK